MTQVGADHVRPAVDELRGQAELVERLVPELLLRPRAENPVADPGSGGETTIARTRPGRSRATAWAIRLPMS
jgi:hypothetical protein